MSSLPVEQTWLVLVELITDLRRHKVDISPRVTNDIRLAKSTINFYKVDPTDPERMTQIKRINDLLNSAQNELLTLAQEQGEDYTDQWLDKLKMAARGEEVYPIKESAPKFVVGAPPGFSMVRVNFKSPLAEDRVQEIAEYHNVIIEFVDDRLIAIYGSKDNLQASLKEIAPFLQEQLN